VYFLLNKAGFLLSSNNTVTQHYKHNMNQQSKK